ncbi:MAG: hypothetical protein U0840_17845 [Gemmataceae bacterium]
MLALETTNLRHSLGLLMPDGETTPRRASDGPDLTLCSICQTLIPTTTLDDHLRQAHQLHTYRGVRRFQSDTLAAILGDLISLKPDDVAWQGLVKLAREEGGLHADRQLVEWLTPGLERLTGRHLPSVCEALAPVMAPVRSGLFLELVASSSPAVRRLALACAPTLRPPIDRYLRRALRGLIADGKLPLRGRIDALVSILPQLEQGRAARLLTPLVSGQRRREALAVIEEMQGRAGALPVLTAFRDRLEGAARQTCPRCGVELRRHHMIAHLWAEHRLVLDGSRVRDPWGLVEEWLDQAQVGQDRTLVQRCRVTVEKIDPERGPRRLLRMLLARNLADPAAKQAYLNEARDQYASCCPRCFALVPMPGEQAPLAIKFRSDRLTALGYHVAIDQHGLRPILDVVSPEGVIYHGMEPDHPWTAAGAAFLFALIVVLLALLTAMLWPRSLGRPIQPVAILLLLAWLVHFGVRLAYQVQTPLRERLVEYTWQLLVPEFHARGFSTSDSAFAAGLAAWHSRQGQWELDLEALPRLISQTTEAVERHLAPAGHLAALVRLRIEMLTHEGADPVPLVVQWIDRCFQGKLPLAFAQSLLEQWSADWWTRTNLARLRILLCDRAFEAGFEVQTLLDAGLTAPALGTVLSREAPRPLAALRLIWSMRATRPWDRLNQVQTAFEIAARPEQAEVLGRHPELLLQAIHPDVPLAYDGHLEKPGPARVMVTLAGVWLQGVIFSIPPRIVEVNRRSYGSQMILGGNLFRSSVDLDRFSREIERWFRWVFHEFLPQVDRVLGWQSPHRDALLRAWGAMACPECGKHLLPGVGEVGLAIDDRASP